MFKSEGPEGEGDTRLIQVELPVESLEFGMKLVALDRPWIEVPVLFQGIVLKGRYDLETVRKHCAFVYIEIEERYWRKRKQHILAKAQPATYPGLREAAPIRDVLPEAEKAYEMGNRFVRKLMGDVQKDLQIDVTTARQVVKSCLKSIMANANAMFWLCRIKDQDAYTAEHCLRVGVLAMAFGRFLDFSQEEIEMLGICGMLHDVGKMKIPDQILNKPGRLTDDEMGVMREHPSLGKTILGSQKTLEPMVMQVAETHHERVDGKGYPHQLPADRIDRFSRVISIVDAYDAITSDRCYKKGESPSEAISILFQERDTHFDQSLVEAFIRMIGIYPAGSLVEMTNGEIAIVMSSNQHSKLRPVVELIRGIDGKIRAPLVVDLAAEMKDEFGQVYAIKRSLPDGTNNVNLSDYFTHQ